MWKPIQTRDDLPPLGTRESINLDFKSTSTTDRFEAAKDIAALANAEGGTLLIGAAGKDQVVRYEPMSEEDAKAAIRVHDEAVRDRCQPAPRFSVIEIPMEGGGSVVAVNVWPFLGQIVGVRLKRDEVRCGTAGSQLDGAMWLPSRVGTHTRSITPEQIPMFIDAHARRIAISLSQTVGQRVILIASRYRKEGVWLEVAVVQSVEPLNDTVTLTVGEKPNYKVSLPFNLIEAVCQAGDQWHVYVRGVFKPMVWGPHASPEMKKLGLVFNPSG